jgi:hypothetical protein
MPKKVKPRPRRAGDGGQSVPMSPTLFRPGSNPGTRGARVQAPGNNDRDGGAGIVGGLSS